MSAISTSPGSALSIALCSQRLQPEGPFTGYARPQTFIPELIGLRYDGRAPILSAASCIVAAEIFEADSKVSSLIRLLTILSSLNVFFQT